MQNVALLTRDSAPNVALLERTPAAVAPTITTTALPGGIVGTAYSQVIQVTGTEPITASVLSGALPAGLTLAGATRTISGTPTTPVAASFTARASNSAGSGDKALSILIPNEGIGGQAPTVTTVTLVPVTATVAAGSTTDLIVTVEDQDGSPISGISGAAETTSAANATAQWLAPTDTSGQATIRVSGIAQGSASIRAVVDGVQSNSTAVAITAGPVAPTITTTSLPGGAVGVAYSQALAASGDAPITWSIQAGALPAGLALNAATGVISGTPTTPVAASFTARASNSAGSGDKALSILIPNEGIGGQAPTVTTVTLVPVSATVEAGGTTDLIVTVEDQSGNPIPNIVGSVETTSAASATGAWLVPTDASGQATVRVTGVAAGVSDVRAMADGLQSNATHVSVTASSVIACGFGVLEIAAYPVSVGQGSVINCGLGVVELQAYPVEVEPSTVIDARLGVIELEGIRPTVGANPTAEPSQARMMILKPDWIEGSGFMMVRGAPTFVKSDDEDLDFSIKWGGIFTAGETLVASRWNVPSDLDAGPATLLGDIATQWLGAGVVGQTYDVDNIVQTSKGRTYERSFRVYIVER